MVHRIDLSRIAGPRPVSHAPAGRRRIGRVTPSGARGRRSV